MKIKEQKKFIDNKLNYTKFTEENKFLKKELLEFLEKTTNYKTLIYSNYNNFICNSYIIPKKELNEKDIEDLINWNNLESNSGYDICKNSKDHNIVCPMDDENINILKNSDPIVFSREIPEYYNILELNQKIEQILNLHKKEEEKYEILDNMNDFQEIVTLCENDKIKYCLFDEKYLNYYLYLSKSILIRLFYVDFIKDNDFEWNGKQIEEKDNENNIYYKLTLFKDNENKGYYRGFQIIENYSKAQELINNFKHEQKYEKFKLLNEKGNEIEVSCNPKKNKINFRKSIFFKNDVLNKYEHNSSKFTIENGSIHCKGSWSLKYYLNKVEEVHVFLKDLCRIPFEEQKYWKAYNILSEEDINKQAIDLEIKGDWFRTPEKIEILKENISNFPLIKHENEEICIFKISKTLLSIKNINSIKYIETNSPEEIEKEVNFLNKIIIESLKEKKIKKLIKNKKNSNEEYIGNGSIKNIEKLLNQNNIKKHEIELIIKPLNEFKQLRNKIMHTGHKMPNKESVNKKIDNLFDSINLLCELINSGKLNNSTL